MDILAKKTMINIKPYVLLNIQIKPINYKKKKTKNYCISHIYVREE